MPDVDVVVIGTGPGGEGAAMACAKGGKGTVVVERFRSVGGGCTHWGTIPSKALRHAIFRHAQLGAGARAPRFADLVRTAEGVIRRQVDMRSTFYERNRVRIVTGVARVVDAHTVAVRDEHGGDEHFTCRQIVLATGSRPARPAGIDFNHPRVRDSDSILRLTDTPASITIYGAGVVGCEYASMFRNLGVKVNLVNTRDRLLSFLDDEISDALSYHLRESGVLIRHLEQSSGVEVLDDGVVLNLQSGKKLKTDLLLWANGRSGNSDGLGLEAVGIAPDARGNVPVNEFYQTSVPSIYAVGDLSGPPSLASAAYDQGRIAGTHIVKGAVDYRLGRDIPTGIYTSPEISSIGRTERELTTAKVPYEVGHSLFRSLARAQITGQAVGMLKILFHRETREVLGIHCFGYQATEIIHIGQAIMMQPAPNNTIDWFANTTFNYPTMAEAYRVAALNGLNRLF
jgi:NAD(P) transhydrogenase